MISWLSFVVSFVQILKIIFRYWLSPLPHKKKYNGFYPCPHRLFTILSIRGDIILSITIKQYNYSSKPLTFQKSGKFLTYYNQNLGFLLHPAPHLLKKPSTFLRHIPVLIQQTMKRTASISRKETTRIIKKNCSEKASDLWK